MRTPMALWPTSVTGAVFITLLWLYGLGQILAAYQPVPDAALVVDLIPAKPDAPQPAEPPKSKPIVKLKPKPKPKPKPIPKPVPTPVVTPEPEPLPELEPETETATQAVVEPIVAPAPTAPPAPKVVPLFKLTKKPVLTSGGEAIYPKIMEKSGIESEVEIEFLVGPEGLVLEVTLIKSGGAEFDAAAIAAVRSMKFTPGFMGDQAVAVRYRRPYVFRLQ